MAAHEADLRAEVEQELAAGRDPWEGRSGTTASTDDAPRRAAAFAADIAAQGSEAAPGRRLRALLQFAERLTLAPREHDERAIAALREEGLDDRAIHDTVQVVSYFNYINRIADGLGVDLEPEMRRPEE